MTEIKKLELKQETIELLEYINTTHRYSMSRIYGLYNEIFRTNETPQTCASCLIRKKNDLEKWVADETYIPPYLRHIDKIK